MSGFAPSACAKGETLDFSRPGKPTDNSLIEACDGLFRSTFRCPSSDGGALLKGRL